ncbi:hypothetical protein BC829DRAFT_443044 [Chytridium lagenaria]|nr:hypothetical protein BC829DRAFT_443044 [Chytridium lagenaria]
MPQHHLCVSRFLEAIDGDILNGARAWGNWVTTVNRIPDPIDRRPWTISTNISLDSSTQRFHKSPLQAAEDYLSFVEIQSQNGKNYRPSRTILQKFVEGYARLGDLSSAERWHRYMQSIGLNLDAWGFRALSDAMMKSAVRGWRFGESDGSEASSKPVPPLPSSAHIPPTVSVNMNAASGSNGEDAVASLTLRAPLGPSDVCDYILSSAKQVGLGPPFPAPIVSILAKGLFSVGDIGRALELCKLSNSSIRWIILPNAHDKAPKYLKREVEKLLDYDFHLATVLLEGLFANRFTKVANVVATIIVKRKTSPVVDNILSKQRSITAQRLSANVNSAKFFVQEGTLGLGGWSLEVAALHYRMTGVVVRALAKRGLLRQAIDILTTSLRLDPSHQESIEERFHLKGFSTKGDLSSGLNVFRHALVLALRSRIFLFSMEMLAATRQHDQAGRIDPIAIWRQPKISSKYSNGIHFTSFVAAPAKECDSVAPKQDTIVSSTGVLPLFDNETFAGAYVSSRRKDVSPRERFLSDLTSCLNGVFESVGKTHAGWAKDKDFPTFLRIVSRKLMRDADAGCILFHALQDQEDAAGICFADAVSGSPNGTLDIDPKALVELQRMYLRLNRSESASAIASELAKYRLQSMELFGPTAVVEELAIRSCEDQAGFRPHRVLLPFDRLKEGGRLADSGYNIM